MSAVRAAQAMLAGIRKVVPDAVVDLCPIADGGEGTLEAISAAVPGKLHTLRVAGPLGDALEATFASFADDALVVVESATAAGLNLISDAARDPTRTTTHGVGSLLLAACATASERIIVGVGGTCTNDGGCGMAQAIGIRFYDVNGMQIRTPLCGGSLRELSRIDASTRSPLPGKIDIVVASDVDNPLTGPRGAATVYGPQKGASPDQVIALDDGLRHLAELLRRDLNVDIEDLPGSGAAGGLAGGLVAFAGARIASGIDTVLEAVDFDRRIAGADLCLTGEGCIDAQSASGKAVMGVTRAALRHRVPTVALVGAAGPGAELCLESGLQDYLVIGEHLPTEVSMGQADVLLAEAAGQTVLRHLQSPSAN